MVLNFINWDVNPEIVNINVFDFAHLSIRWYGLFFAISFYLGYLIFQKFFKLEKIKIELLDSLLLYMFVAIIVGARLGHCLFYDFDYYISNPFDIIKIWEGGLASHGAAIGILIALYIWCKKFDQNFLWLFDRIVIAVAIGGFFIRMGNLMNSEIYGIETTMPWGFIFLRNNEIMPKHPTQIYEALSYLLIFLTLIVFYFKNILINKKGKFFGVFLISLFSARFFIEYIKNPQSDFETSLPLFMGQILSIPFIIAGIILLLLDFDKIKKVK